jgi:hypothetical protein
MTTKQIGGKVIASGGFGCIFDPALKCENTDVISSDQISKLMTVKHSKDEFKQIQKYKRILSVIPNYHNYFLLDNFQLCKPIALTKNDLNGYQKKCKALKKKGINVKNINQSLDQLLAINMPNGGIDVEKFTEEYFTTSNIIRLNNSLIQLLVNGIVPMNKLNVYHCDIKDGNVLVKVTETDLETRLIDWGLSFVFDNKQVGIPRKLYRRPFQFNVPFSSVLFNKDFMMLYNNFLELNPNPDYFQIREFVINYIFIWNDIRGPGHLSAINDIIKKLTIKDLTAIKKNKIKEHFIEYDFTYYYIVEYLSKILEKYTNNETLDLMTYFQNVFLKNIDIWGFTMIYIVFYENLYKDFNELNQYQMEFITKIKYIIIHFLYESPIEPIDVSSLVNELTNLNKVIEKFDLDHVSKKLEYVSSLEDNIGGFIQHKKKQKSKTHKKKHLSLEKGKVRKTVGFLVNKKQKTRKRRLY